MQLHTLLLFELATFTNAMLRFQCSQLVRDRLDPLVQPGMAPTTHIHQIVGGVCIFWSLLYYFRLILSRMGLMWLWTSRAILLIKLLVLLVNSPKISPITGRLFYTSAPETAPISASCREVISVLMEQEMEGWLSTMHEAHVSTMNRRPRLQPFRQCVDITSKCHCNWGNNWYIYRGSVWL